MPKLAQFGRKPPNWQHSPYGLTFCAGIEEASGDGTGGDDISTGSGRFRGNGTQEGVD